MTKSLRRIRHSNANLNGVTMSSATATELTMSIKPTTSGGTRTHNPRLRRPVPYPLGHRGFPEMQRTMIVMIWNVKITKTKEIYKSLGDTRVWTRDLSICSRMLYHWAISPAGLVGNCSKEIAPTLAKKMVQWFWMKVDICGSETLAKKSAARGHLGLNRGPLNLQSNALPLSYTPYSGKYVQFSSFLLQ